MNDDFDKLKAIGTQKIHESTHITRKFIESILNENFEDMNKIQLMGFISILEREYSLDLEELKHRATEYFAEHNSEEIHQKNLKLFGATKRQKTFTPLNIIIVVVIFVSFLLFNKLSHEESPTIIQVDNSVIDSAKNNISINSLVENNISTQNLVENNDTNISLPVETNPIQVEESEITSLKIYPKVEVWLGYIDLETYKRYQKTFSDELELDTNKDWLLAFGHGHIVIEVNGDKLDYTIKKNVRFSYIDSKLQEISLEEFKKLNKGNRW